jgi:serpin B
VAQLETRRVNLFLPRFTIAPESVDVRGQLAALGMPLAFTFQANFLGMNGHEPPHEDGSALNDRPRPIPLFRADHPFLFAIRDRNSDTILFLGRMMDPTRDD